VQGLARDPFEGGMALNRPKARPSKTANSRAKHTQTATVELQLGLPCHSMALDDQKSKCYCMFLRFYAVYNYLATPSTPAVSHGKQEKFCLPSLHCRHGQGPCQFRLEKIGRHHMLLALTDLFFIGSSVNQSSKSLNHERDQRTSKRSSQWAFMLMTPKHFGSSFPHV
jgi:hypothetical protein